MTPPVSHGKEFVEKMPLNSASMPDASSASEQQIREDLATREDKDRTTDD